MLLQPILSRRRGVRVVECAMILPVTFMFILFLIVGGMGVYRYQETAELARSGARYASTHGAKYRKDAVGPP
jgi:Flp pilus assembly protein TadG